MDTPTDIDKSTSGVSICTYRFKVRSEAYRWLNAAAKEVNATWNFCNATSFKAARPYFGKPRWLSGFDLCSLTAGATDYFEHIGADTIQRICIEYAQKRVAAKKVKLAWRRSREPHGALGWIPLKAASIRRQGKYLRFYGKMIRIFEAKRFAQIKKWKQGCFSQDALGDWYLNLPVEQVDQTPAPIQAEVGIDFGLKDTAVTSDGERLAAGTYYRSLETSIAQAQRRGHQRQAKRLHRRAARRRQNALHQFSRSIVNRYQHIYMGDVSSLALSKTRMAKAVLDCSWGQLRAFLLYKSRQAGRIVKVVSEVNTTRTCYPCRALTGPTGLNGLRVREWVCSGCGEIHDRDVNSARNHILVGRKPPSGDGNERLQRPKSPSRASRPRKARTTPAAAAS